MVVVVVLVVVVVVVVVVVGVVVVVVVVVVVAVVAVVAVVVVPLLEVAVLLLSPPLSRHYTSRSAQLVSGSNSSMMCSGRCSTLSGVVCVSIGAIGKS